MNVKGLIDQCRIEVADYVAPYLWTDRELIIWLAEAEEEAVIRARLLRDKSTAAICQIDVQAGISVYALDPSVVEIIYASMVLPGSTGMFPWVLGKTTSDDLDMERPSWRVMKCRPTNLIHYDTTIELDAMPDTYYTLNLEVYRLPISPMERLMDEPEINAIHHRHLLKWVKHRAYAKQDADTMDEVKSQKFLAEFVEKFGEAPDASYRKRRNANRPHRNRVSV